MSGGTVLELRDVRRVHGSGGTSVLALDGVSLSVAAGELVAVMGPSGSGKSTLLLLAGGLDSATSGEVLVEGVALSGLNRVALAALRRRSVGYVFQDLNLVPALTAAENVALPRELDGVPARAARKEALAALEEVGVGDLGDRFPDDMSGGQQQRVAIARALVGDRRLVLADEPTGALDTTTGEAVLRVLRARVDAGAAGVLVTHEARHAAWADRVVFLRDGRTVDDTGPVTDADSVGAPVSWRPSLRIAARDARRAKARSALIVAMIALPVVALSFADVMWRTAQPSTQEQLARDLGQADASVQVVGQPGGGLIQAADPRGWRFTSTGESSAEQLSLRDLDLPAGLRLVVEDQRSIQTATEGGRASLGWTELDAADPTFAGRWRLQAGRYPTSPTEVTLTPAMAARTGLHLGDSLRTLDPDRTFTVVGEVSREGERDAMTAVALPGTLIGAPGGLPKDAPYASTLTGFLVGAPVTWADVQRLNERGAVVTSRAVLADPPSSTPYDELALHGSDLSGYLIPVLILAMVVGLSGLIVVLLAGTAFAVGARRQTRSLALVAAAGGSRRDLRRIVLAGGLVLGTAAGVVGVALGVFLAAVLVQLIWRRQWLLDASLASFDIRPLELLAIAGIGVVTGVLAAVVPARQAARLDVVAALRGRSGLASRSRRTPVVGLLMIVAGVVLSVLGSGWVVTARRDGSVTAQNLVIMVLVGGAGLVLLGLVFCSGWVVSLVSRLAPRLPLAGRLALRDAHRHRSRTAPAVAAVLAAVSGSVAVMLYVAALDQSDRERYTPGSPAGTATVNLVAYDQDPKTGEQTTSYLDPDRVMAALGTTLPVAEAIPIVQPVCASADCSIPVDWNRPKANQCSWPEGVVTAEQVAQLAESDPRCDFPQVDFSAVRADSNTAVGGPELLTLTGGTAPPDAVHALASGGMVVVDRLLLDEHGRVAVQAFVGGRMKTVLVPAVVVPVEDMTFNAVLSPALVRSLAVKTATARLLLRLDGPVSTQAEDAARAALDGGVGTSASLYVERGYDDNYGLGLLALAAAAAVITLGATGIATGLSLTDARADHATLGAIGAPPRLRRRLAAAQAVTVGAIGVLLGVLAGAVPALSIIGAVDSLTVVWPWPQLLGLVVGVPLLSAAFAYVFTRSRVPLQRRVVA